jgi:hypothetical protein
MPDEIPPQVLEARREVVRLEAERATLLRDAAAAGRVDHAGLSALDDRIGGLLDDVLPLVDPCDASASEPLVLLPVRLETRYTAIGGGTALRVRVYPDEIHVDDLVRGLTDDEVVAGQAYWTSVWTEPVPEAAWLDLVATVGVDRAEWVAHECTPTNLAERATAATPVFPTPAARGPRNVVARALPDRFVVVAVQGDQVSQAVGHPIPRDLALSPIPLEGDDPTRVADALTIPPGSEWLVEYERAEAVGMAVTVPLAGGNAPIQRVVAIGTRASAGATAGADELEDLFVGHRFGAGLGLLAQGAPTNNADAERSPFRSRRTPVAPALTPPVAVPGSDASAAAGVLGIDATQLTALVGDGTGEQAVATLVNTALWAPGWGEFLSRLDKQGVPGVVDAQRESARGLFRDHVRGRGPAPAIRVGAQPYGVLPASDLDAWVPARGETTAGIVKAVRTLFARWLFAAVRAVPQVRPGTPGVDDTIVEVLGSSPVMQGLRVRPVLTDDVSAVVLSSLGIDHREYEAEKISTTAVAADLVGAAAVKIMVGSLHRDTRPLPLPLASPRDPEFITALLGTPRRTLAVDSVLQALLVLAWDSAELDVAKASPATVLPSLAEMIELEPVLKARVTATVARADAADPDELHAVVGLMQDAGVSVGGASMLRDYQPVEPIQTSLAEVALSAPLSAQSRQLAAAALAEWLRAMGYRGEVRAAMHALVTTTVEARRLAVAEALDCSSHRLDAWATAIVAERRARQASRRGLTIGAYGVVEQLRPQTDQPVGGWIYAPSTRHAIAAGMLRSSHLSHLPGAGGGPFAIDLSSRRIQAAAHVIEGVRHGQQLGALVGYQIERGLADARLARLQLSLRTIAPLFARRLHDTDGQDDQAAREAVAANNVVDGVLLLKLHPPGDPALRARLDQVPQNSYLDPADWVPLTNAEWSTVTAIMSSATDTIDAVADIMLCESVLQFAGGNPHRAAAAMDAMSTGSSPSDTVDMLEANDSGERLTHKVLAIVGDGAPSSNWSTVRPRALVEPRLEAWAAAHLGDPADIVVAETADRRVTLAEAGYAALDLVFATDLNALERSLRVAIADLGTAPLAVNREPGWPEPARALGQVAVLAATLRATIAGSHALLPADLTRPGEPAARDLEAALAELDARVTALAASLNATVAGLEATIAALPEDGIVDDDTVAAGLVEAVYALDPFGIPLEPIAGRPLDVSWVRSAWQAAEARGLAAAGLAGSLASAVANTPANLRVEQAQEVASAVYGDGFLVVPVLPPATLADEHGVPLVDRFVEAVTNPVFPAPSPSSVRRFVRDVSTVRRQVTRLSEALLLEGAFGHPRQLEVLQLTERAAEGPAPGTTHWLAGPLPAEGPWPATPVAHVVVDRVGTVDDDSAVAGLVIDAWVEDLPAQVGPNADPADPRPGRARTALAVQCNSASARPPQAVLCAISPDGERWTTDSLRRVVEHTLDLARVRMVTLERLPGDGLVLPALYTRSSSLQGQKPYLMFAQLAEAAKSYTAMPFVKELAT